MIEIPNYEIGSMTGRGGVAEVYKATHKLLDRTVAIKIISHAKSGDVADKRFLKEARVVAGLRHPNIVSIYDVGVLEDKYYIIMEFLEGGDLKQKLEAGVSVDESIAILKQMASALAHAHDKGFIHRDIKSQNIMFRSDGTAVLTDFGIVKDLTVDSGYTMDGTSVGTPHYMSPEQAQGSSAIDWRTDLYSLGVTFYEMITGSVPYTADSAVAVALRHIKDPVPRLPAHLSRYQTIIDRLMAKRPEKRFQSAHELLEALERLPSADKTEPLADTLELTDRTALHAPRSPLKRGFFYTAAVLAAVAVIAGGVLFFGPFEQLRQKIGPFISQTVTRSEQGGAPEAQKTEAQKTGAKKTEAEKADTEKAAADAVEAEKSGPRAPGSEKAEKEKAGSLDREAAPPARAEKMPIQGQSSEKAPRKPRDAARLYQSAQALFEQGNYTAALELTRQALSQAPDHKELKKLLLLCKARISVEENRLSVPDDDNALAYYRQLLELDPDNPEARKGIETIAGRFENQARSAYQNKDYDRALDNIAKYREIRPADEDAELMEWMIRGSRQYAAGRYLSPEGDSAAYYFRKVLNKAPQKEEIARRLARARVLGPLSEIDPGTSIQEQLPRFQKVFKALQAGIEEHGTEAMEDVRQSLAARLKAVVDAGIERAGAIPDAFIALVTEHLPEFSDIFKGRYKELVAGGDDARGLENQADFYLKALRLDPSRDPAREKIKTVARQMLAQGDAKAVVVLKEAMNTVSDDGDFKAMLERIQAVRDAKAELFTRLYQIKGLASFSEKIPAYRNFFDDLESAADQHGRQKMADPLETAREQLKNEVLSQKKQGHQLPEAFIELTVKHFPELEDFIADAQYEILIKKAEQAKSVTEKADMYISALALNPNRPEASEAIRALILAAEKNGDHDRAISMLDRAMAAAPSNGLIAELDEKIGRHVEIYPTASGCGEKNRITEAPVTLDALNFCLEYRNMAPDSIVHVSIAKNGGQSMDMPVLLQSDSGSRTINLSAPVEGFTVGPYSITVKQNQKILSSSRIQFIPKRR